MFKFIAAGAAAYIIGKKLGESTTVMSLPVVSTNATAKMLAPAAVAGLALFGAHKAGLI